MNQIVIDAQIVAAYYKEEMGTSHDCTGSVSDIFLRLGSDFTAYIDSGGHIENEYKSVVKVEWISIWLTDMLRDAKIKYVDAPCNQVIEHKLANLGFPTSKDKWYVRTYLGGAENGGCRALVTEDMDFFDPRKKGSVHGHARINFMKKRKGKLLKWLEKMSVHIFCVSNFKEQFIP